MVDGIGPKTAERIKESLTEFLRESASFPYSLNASRHLVGIMQGMDFEIIGELTR